MHVFVLMNSILRCWSSESHYRMMSIHDSFNLVYVLIGKRAPYWEDTLYIPYKSLICCLVFIH